MTITFCIVCMNRIEHLKQTLLENIRNFENNPDVYFILLDYNSKDGLDFWAKDNLADYIKSGKLVYYKTFQPRVFDHSHSKNMMFNLATSDLVCNINADHFIGEGFDKYILSVLQKEQNIFLSHNLLNKMEKVNPPVDLLGKVCLRKKDFRKVRGFDERFKDYGFEDTDFLNRLLRAGLNAHVIKHPIFMKYLKHDDYSRVANSSSSFSFEVYVSFIDPSQSFATFLYDDGSFEQFHFLLTSALNSDKYSNSYKRRSFIPNIQIKESNSRIGKWKIDNEKLCLETNSSECLLLIKEIDSENEGFLIDKENGTKYFKINDYHSLFSVKTIRSFALNHSFLLKNQKSRKYKVNPGGYGRGIVYKNFDYERSYEL